MMQIFFRSLFLLAGLFTASHAIAIVEPENQGRWTKPTDKKGPDKEVPGFLINLGPTGARAVLREDRFVVKHVFVESPSEGLLLLEDEITGANGKPFSKHTFGHFYGMKFAEGIEGPMMDLGNAIEDSEGSDGKLKLAVVRDGKPIQISIPLEPIGRFRSSYPIGCKKSERLAKNVMEYLLSHPDEHTGMVHEKGKYGLALLAQGKIEEAEKLAMNWNEPPGEKSWTWYPSYQCIFLCEYYLKTKDKRVLETIEELCKRLYLAQVIDPALYKDRMHGGKPQAKNFLKGGLGHGNRIAGYGTMTITTLMAMLSWELAEDCGIEIDQKHLEIAYGCIHEHTHESGYMGYRFGTGAYTPVGRQGLSILVHNVAGDRKADEYVTRVSHGLANARTRLNDGHGDNVQAVFWGLLGVQHSPHATDIRKFLDYNKAFINLSRTHDGAFVVQPGRNKAEKAYYLSPRIHPTAAMVIALGTGSPRLRIQRNDQDKAQN